MAAMRTEANRMACCRSLNLRAMAWPPSERERDEDGDHRGDPDATSRATGRPFPPSAPPPTNTVSPWTAGDEIPASTSACQSSVPVARSMGYTFPSFAGAMSRGPAMAGDAATEPAVGKNQFSSPVVTLRARTPYGGGDVTSVVVVSVPLLAA